MIPEDITPPAHFTRSSPEESERAARQMLANATDRDDALDLLDMLGLDVPARKQVAA
ncbi:hypothetical protein [Streptomyces sp. A13(2022)]|uniref:hypothetical protein n=1 Tax=Streptomyces sp. A13(2022) TaxID=2964768 RepID=UPI0021D87CBD|nr:hypothetical protein [Streptomyces sp. A13(2022)]MCU8589350.1 hypothetical protein [Streptomyces sp. A13(2022)]